MLPDSLMNEVDAFDGNIPGALRPFDRKLFFDRTLALRPHADQYLAAIAAGRAPAETLRFQQRDRVTTLGKLECTRDAGIAAPHDADIDVDALSKGRCTCRAADCRFIVGLRDAPDIFL